MGSESRSMKETVPVPYPYVCGPAGTAALCPLLLPLPFQALWCRAVSPNSQPFPMALPLGSPGSCAQGRGLGLGLDLPRAEVQVHSLLAAVGLVAPLQVLHLLRGGFAHILRPPPNGGPSSPLAHLPQEGPEQLCSLCAI